MRQFFFMAVLIGLVMGGIGYYIWSVITALYYDWSLGRGVDQIKQESAARREERRQAEKRRLENGCDHVFGESFGGFPPNACHKCGLEDQRPSGPCDHVWKFAAEAMPCSFCEKCGRKYISPLIR